MQGLSYGNLDGGRGRRRLYEPVGTRYAAKWPLSFRKKLMTEKE